MPAPPDFRALFAAVPGPYVVLSREFVIVAVTEAYLAATMTRREEIVGRSILDVFPTNPADPEAGGLEALRASLEEVLRTRAPVRQDVQKYDIPRPEAAGGGFEERYWRRYSAPVLDAAGEVAWILRHVEDVTAAIKAEAEERHVRSEIEERFRRIANSAPVPMWVTVPGGGPREFVNQAYMDFLGVGYDEALVFDWRKIIHADDIRRILVEQREGEASHRPFSLEARFRRADGEWRWLRTQSQPRLSTTGEHVGFIGAAFDITDAKQAAANLQHINELLEERVTAAFAEKAEAEQALRQAQKMEAVGQLTGGIAHDFNNLLTAVLGNLELLDRRVTEDPARRLLENARRAAERGAALTAQLLAFSRKQHLRPAAVDLTAAIAGMEDLLVRSMGKRVGLATELAADAWPAFVDLHQIELAILNLVINARDAMEHGGTVTIATSNVPAGSPALPREVRHQDCVLVAVADTGVGMSEDVMARAFEPFFTTKEPGKGSGLGLSMVYGIAQQSGGTVRIRRRPGAGTTVEVFLPRAPAADIAGAVRPPRQGASATVRAPARVLVVDDEEDVRDVAAAALREYGYEVEVAASGEAALEALGHGDAYDLLLVDVAMPGVSGVEMVRLARKTRPRLKVVFVTGYADISAFEALAADEPLVKKPFRLDELERAVREALAAAVAA
jgi:PAS domain S-box-containing protein